MQKQRSRLRSFASQGPLFDSTAAIENDVLSLWRVEGNYSGPRSKRVNFIRARVYYEINEFWQISTTATYIIV